VNKAFIYPCPTLKICHTMNVPQREIMSNKSTMVRYKTDLAPHQSTLTVSLIIKRKKIEHIVFPNHISILIQRSPFAGIRFS
jgi:hypothetical protein